MSLKKSKFCGTAEWYGMADNVIYPQTVTYNSHLVDSVFLCMNFLKTNICEYKECITRYIVLWPCCKLSFEPNLSFTKVCRSEEHTSELQSRETISYAVFCLKKKKKKKKNNNKRKYAAESNQNDLTH